MYTNILKASNSVEFLNNLCPFRVAFSVIIYIMGHFGPLPPGSIAWGGDDYESHSDRRHGNNQDRSRDNRVYGSYDYGSDSDRYGSPSDPRALLDP